MPRDSEATNRAEQRFKPRPEGPQWEAGSLRTDTSWVWFLGTNPRMSGEARAPGAHCTVGLRSEKGVRWSAAWQADLTDHFLLFRDLGPPRLHPAAPQGLPGNVGDRRGCHRAPSLLTSEPGPAEGEACAEAQHVQTLRWTH